MPSLGERFFGKECWIAGFGRTNQKPREYNDLLQETLTIVNEDCGPYSAYTFPKYTTMCVGYNGATTGCNGDSGGPLVCEGNLVYSKLICYKLILDDNGNFVLAGVASWASVECLISEPTGYASVADARDWILDVTGI